MIANQDQELEVKFYLADLQRLRQRLTAAGARLIQPRVHEINLRFDTPDGALSRTSQVLRLRRDNNITMTYKDPGELTRGVRSRREIELTVDDFSKARSFLEALGFQVSLTYEKYRTTFILDLNHVTLDEMPFGYFTEIEGPTAKGIRIASLSLGLNWDARITDSYTRLFENLRSRMNLRFRDLTFENFTDLVVTPELLEVTPGDIGQFTS